MFDLLKTSQSLLRIPSCSSAEKSDHLGNIKVVNFLVRLTKKYLQHKILKPSKSSKDAVLVLWPKAKKFPRHGGLALHTHLDTVHPGSLKKWTLAKPFAGRLVRKKLVGVGAADVKLDSLCKISALIAESSRNFKITPFFVGSFSEEIGMLGMKWLAQKKYVKPQFALIGEPSEGHLSFANKGFAVIRAEISVRWVKPKSKPAVQIFKGKSAHSSAPQKGINAIHLALESISKTPQIEIESFFGSIGPNTISGEFGWTSKTKCLHQKNIQQLLSLWKAWKPWAQSIQKQGRSALFKPATATSNWTELKIVENKIIVTIDLRFLPGQRPQELMKNFKSKVPIKLLRNSPSFFQSPRDLFGRKLKPLLRGRKFITKSGSNEAAFYQDLGAEAFVHAPGVSYGNIHSPNESIEVKSLFEAKAFYQRVIESICVDEKSAKKE